MRIRTIKPEFWLHEKLAECSEFTRLLAIALLNWADDEGYFLANPILIRGQVFPFLDDSKKVPRSIQELSSVGWIQLGSDESGRAIGRVINFAKHQRVDKPKPSVFKDIAQFQDESKTHPRFVQDASKEEWNGREGNGMEGVESISSATADLSLQFQEIIDAWNATRLPSIRAITKDRKNALKARMAEEFFRDNFREGITRASESPFCTGSNDRGWTATFDWFLKPGTLAKILEGKYEGKPQVIEKPKRELCL